MKVFLLCAVGWWIAGAVVFTVVDSATENRFRNWYDEAPHWSLKACVWLLWPVVLAYYLARRDR